MFAKILLCGVSRIEKVIRILVIEGKMFVERRVVYSKTCVKRPLKNKDIFDKWKLNEGLPLEHSAILLTCIKR